ncbi:tRNA (adenosine(37)-N6)-threonylcarbamoyltransferase complex ATPase subunit type 1 TsaE [Enterococcus sp. LJL99]
MKISVQNLEKTEQLGLVIGKLVSAGDVIILSGDLGAGKTTFTKSLALGLGIEQMIKSPTYTIIREYQTGRLPLYHMDVYRIGGEADELGLEEYFEGDGVSVVEWGQLLEENLPENYLAIDLEKESENLEKRIMTIKAHGRKAEKLLQKIEKLEELK